MCVHVHVCMFPTTDKRSSETAVLSRSDKHCRSSSLVVSAAFCLGGGGGGGAAFAHENLMGEPESLRKSSTEAQAANRQTANDFV